MQDFLTVTAMVIKTFPIGDYDRRVVMLTKEKGKISAFAKGARKPNSKFLAQTNPFSFGEFTLFVGKNSYNIVETNVMKYFEGFRTDFEGAYYGMYFLEIADYFTRENNDEKEMLKLLYQTMKALGNINLAKDLVRCIFEIKALVVNGEFPGLPKDRNFLKSTRYTVHYIQNSNIEKLYTFGVKEEVLLELKELAKEYRLHFYDREFKSLEILESSQFDL